MKQLGKQISISQIINGCQFNKEEPIITYHTEHKKSGRGLFWILMTTRHANEIRFNMDLSVYKS